MSPAPVDQLAAALAATERVIAGVRPEQWAAPTPCTEWTARELVNHLLVGNVRNASILRGERPPEAEEVLSAAPDMLSAYRASAVALVEAFRQPGVFERMFTVAFGTVPGFVALHLRTTEALVHGWDLARATGQPAEFPADLAEQELAFSRDNLPSVPAERTPFAASQPVADTAPAIDRLAGLLGRNVAAWVPA